MQDYEITTIGVPIMAASHISGPSIVYGPTSQGAGVTQGNHPELGPSITYQGDGILDVRYPYANGATGVGHIRALLDSPYGLLVDAAPAKYGATVATITTGTVGVLGSYSSGQPGTGFWVVPNTPIIPYGSSITAANAVNTLALDVGFATCTTNGTATITAISRWNALFPGTRVMIAGGTSNAWGCIIAVTATTITLEVMFGIFTAGETLTEYATETANTGDGVTATLGAAVTLGLAEVAPDIVRACEVQVRFMSKHKFDFEMNGTQKDGSVTRKTVQKDAPMLTEEAMALLVAYKKYPMGW